MLSRSVPGGSAAILVHGGAGQIPEAARAAHREGCERAARAGALVLAQGGGALDAVERAVRVLEEDPRFNAGIGACLNVEGTVELDASLMEGRGLRAGAVCAMRGFPTAISVARAVLDDGAHVLLAGRGAEAFAREKGFAEVAPETMVTEAAREALAAVLAGRMGAGWAGNTVGAVAIDASGSSAAATSTGGMIAKRMGRVGDSPLIGAGTYADDLAGAVSTTGHGEGMIRLSTARAIAWALQAGTAPDEACRAALAELSTRLGVTGGAIAIDRRGRLGFARNTETMSWASVALLEGDNRLEDSGV